MKSLNMEEGSGGDKGCSKIFVIVLSLTLVVFAIAIGIGIGYAIRDGKEEKCASQTESGRADAFSEQQDKRYAHHSNIVESMESNKISDNLKEFTRLPHPPGRPRNKELGDILYNFWKDEGMDEVEKFKYNIYLSYPQKPSTIQLFGGEKDKTFTIEAEPPVDDSEKGGKPVVPFNAFSAKGVVKAELVFVNHCRESDYDAVAAAGVSVAGKIAICKYGRGSRNSKTRFSEARGLIGLVLYSDPREHTYPGMEYPKGWMLNKDGVQRGTVNRLPGDALSIGYPSKDGYFRYGEDKYKGNPKIPVQPISAAYAEEILRWMNNDSVALPDGFGGDLNVTYKLQSGKGRELELNVDTKLETLDSYTICSKLFGDEEPDRYIMLGNHRDAWTYGGTDPSSGTATMKEIGRVLGNYRKNKGWRPKRSIMLCSWGAEESGIQGSTEWADDNHKFLMENVIMYLNVDMAVEGNFTVRMKTIDSMIDGIFEAAKTLKAPDDSSKTLYKDWHEKSLIWRKTTADKLPKPYYMGLTSGSDYKALWHAYGTPSADFRYYFSRIEYPVLPQNGHYHTRYESFGWMSKYVDPGFKYHRSIGQLWLAHALRVADSTLLPIDVLKFASQVKGYLLDFETAYVDILKPQDIDMDFAKTRMSVLVKKCEDFKIKVFRLTETRNEISPMLIRMINDKIMNFERSFVLSGLSKDNPVIRHTVYATTYYKLKSTKFPGISEAIYYTVKNKSSDWDEVRKQITYLIWCIDTAIRSLDLEVGFFN